MAIIRTPTRVAGGITPEEKSRLDSHAQMWIDRVMRTEPIDASNIIPAVHNLYAAAGLKKPRVVIVPSPLVMAFAYGAAAAIWYRRNIGDTANDVSTFDATRDTTRDATRDVTSATTSPNDVAANAATDAEAANATREATDDATFDATDAAIDGPTYDATNAATYAATRDKTTGAVDTTTIATTTSLKVAAYTIISDAANDAATDAATADTTRDATSDATCNATADATYDATNVATREAVVDVTDTATRDKTNGTVDTTTRATSLATAYTVICDTTDDVADNETYNATVVLTVNTTVDATRDATVAATSATVAATNDITLENSAAKACLDMAGPLGIACARRWHANYQGGNMWAAYDSYLTGCRDVLGLRLPQHEKYAAWEQCATHGGFRVLHPEFCIVSDFPEILRVDDQHRPHCADGPSHRWRDGWSLYHWHGVRVPARWIEECGSLTVADIFREQNAEVRRAGCEIIGWDQVLQGIDAKIIDEDGDPQIGTLYEGEIPNATKCTFLKVQCGTGRTFVIPTEPGLKTAIEAQAWIQGIQVEKWVRPEVRS